MQAITKLVEEMAKDPFNSVKNFECAVEYDRLGQRFSAISFYLRAAEFGADQNQPLIVYSSLLKVSQCLEVADNRQYSISNCLLQAMTVLPSRPEAYFLLSQHYQKNQQWQESYTMAILGMQQKDGIDLPVDVGYHGQYYLLFQKGVAAYWVHRREESRTIMNTLAGVHLRPEYAEAVKMNLEKVNVAF